MAKAYCPKCKKRLVQVLSSFECLSTWDRAEEYYAPENECKLLKRCPTCGTLAMEKEKRIQRHPKRMTEGKDAVVSNLKKGPRRALPVL